MLTGLMDPWKCGTTQRTARNAHYLELHISLIISLGIIPYRTSLKKHKSLKRLICLRKLGNTSSGKHFKLGDTSTYNGGTPLLHFVPTKSALHRNRASHCITQRVKHWTTCYVEQKYFPMFILIKSLNNSVHLTWPVNQWRLPTVTYI